MNSPQRTTTVLAALVAGALALSACSTEASEPTEQPTATTPTELSSAADIMAAPDLGELDAAEVIEVLEATALSDRPAELFASIRPDELLLIDNRTPNATETALPISDDVFYVSFAPYVSQTHDCFYHSLTTCVGEFGNADFDVVVVDNATGETIVGTSVTTADNGFFGLWLDRDLDATITISQGELSVTGPLSTGPEDPTCVTTLQLA